MKTVLLVEDQPEIRKLIRLTLSKTDVWIEEAADALDGWEAVTRLKPSVVLLDIMMPGGVDGLDLCRRIRSEPALRDTKVVLVSARGHRNDMAIGRDAGADDYLLKPFSPQRLKEVVAAFL